METVSLSKLILELMTLKRLYGDLPVYHITYGSLEKIYAVKVDVLLNQKNEKAVVIY